MIKKLLPFLPVGLAVLAIIFFFFPFVSYSVSDTVMGVKYKEMFDLSGFATAFTTNSVTLKSVAGGTTSTNTFDPDFKLAIVTLLAFFLIVIGGAAAAANVFVKTGFEKLIKLGVAGCLGLAAILIFFTVVNFNGANEVGSESKHIFLGVGAWLAAIVCLAGAGASGYDFVTSK